MKNLIVLFLIVFAVQSVFGIAKYTSANAMMEDEKMLCKIVRVPIDYTNEDDKGVLAVEYDLVSGRAYKYVEICRQPPQKRLLDPQAKARDYNVYSGKYVEIR